jgi:hypothetical protein
MQLGQSDCIQGYVLRSRTEAVKGRFFPGATLLHLAPTR